MQRVSPEAFEAFHILFACQPLLEQAILKCELRPMQMYALIAIDVIGKDFLLQAETSPRRVLPEDYLRSQLIRIFDRSPANVSILFDELKELGLIQEIKFSADDKRRLFPKQGTRRTALSLTTAGEDTIFQIMETFKSLHKMLVTPADAKNILTTPLDSKLGPLARAFASFLRHPPN
jgi:DNA-binding MarR family transcriptional regulator